MFNLVATEDVKTIRESCSHLEDLSTEVEWSNVAKKIGYCNRILVSLAFHLLLYVFSFRLIAQVSNLRTAFSRTLQGVGRYI